jgi:hypothetical protein
VLDHFIQEVVMFLKDLCVVFGHEMAPFKDEKEWIHGGRIPIYFVRDDLDESQTRGCNVSTFWGSL